MTRRDEPHEIVRYLEGEERSFPCCLGHGDDIEECRRPSTMEVYGLPFCEVHGAECASGALEEMHDDAEDFFSRFDNMSVPELDNPLVVRAIRGWHLTLRDDEHYAQGDADELLLAAFPFRADKVIPETAGEIADPIEGQDPPYDAWRHHRHEMHTLMRHAYLLGPTFVVEYLEQQRETCAAQAAYALALLRGEHPEIVERAREQNREDAREVAEHFAQKQA